MSRETEHTLYTVQSFSPDQLVRLAIRWDAEAPENIDKALFCMMLAAAYGVHEACEILGLYMAGANYPLLAAAYYEQAGQSSFIAQCELGLLHMRSGRCEQGLAHLRQAAAAGDLPAQRALHQAAALHDELVAK